MLNRVVSKRQFCTNPNDHRYIGRQQKLWTFNKASPGSAFFLPHGTRIYNKLMQFMRNEQRKRGYQEIITPNIYNQDLWQQSGHLDKYREHIYMIDDVVHEQKIGLKPMNCPGHCLLYGSQLHSFRDLPIRYSDFGALHRNEVHGSLSGLTRVRRFVQDDAHIFCTPAQIQSEISSLLEFVAVVYRVLGFEYRVSLSTRPTMYLGDLQLWDEAETQLKTALAGRPYEIEEGEGAFYGPKIDMHLQDALNRLHQCGTIQLDFNLPVRFDLLYRDSDQSEQASQRPVLIHRAILGSFERMLAILAEQTLGKWPYWLSPRQMLVCNVNPRAETYARSVHEQLFAANIDAELDASDHTLGKKIRDAQPLQYNYIIVVGEKEAKEGIVDVRDRDSQGQHRQMPIGELIALATQRSNPFYL